MNQIELLEFQLLELNAKKGDPFDKIVKRTNQKLQRHLGRFEAGKIDRQEFLARGMRSLGRAYEKAFKKGAGTNKINAAGRKWIEDFKEKQYKYLQGFADAIENGTTVMGTTQRMGMYSNTVRSSYWSGSAIGTKGKVLLDWVTFPGENCDDCLELEENGPYTRNSLPTVPGAGDTVCKGNCNCKLVRSE